MELCLEVVKKSKKQILLQALYYMVIFISLFYKVIYFHKASGIYDAQVSVKYIGIAIIGSIFILVAVALFISFNKSNLVLLIVDLFISILMFADVVYSKYYYNPLTLNVVLYQMQFMGDIKNSAEALFNFRDLILFLDIPVIIVMARVIKEPKGFNAWLAKSAIAILILIVGLVGIHKVYGVSEVEKYAWEKKNMAIDLGVVYYHYSDVVSTVKKIVSSNKPLTDEEVANIDKYKYIKHTNDYTAAAKDKNLIILQLEAIQGFVINSKVNGQEVTPNLNKLINENMYFDNLYFQANYGNTSDAEFLVNNSLYPSKTGAVYYEYTTNKYHSVASVLNDKGYYTAAFHGYTADFWNRTEMYRSMGFQHYYSKDDFVAQKNIGFGISDEEFFKQSLYYLTNESKGKPFYGFMVALSSHHPYNYDYGIPFDVGKYEGTMLGDYLRGAHYVDYAIGQMIDYMKEIGIYDDTVLAIYGDHAAIFEDQAQHLTEFLSIENNDFNWNLIQRVPLIIHQPESNEAIKISKPAGQIDILPTLSNLMDIDIPYMYGRDLLNDEQGYAILPRGNVVTEDFLFKIDEHNFYDIKTGIKIEETQERLEQVRNYYTKKNTTSTILEKNAFKKLEQ